MKVARITRGGLPSRTGRNPVQVVTEVDAVAASGSVVPHWAKSGAGELKSSSLMFGRSQQKS